MRRYSGFVMILVSGLVSAMLALSGAAACSPIPGSTNGLVNGNFETGAPAPWTFGNGLQLYDRTSTGDDHGWAVYCIESTLNLTLRQVVDTSNGGLWNPLGHSMVVDLTADINLTNLKQTLPLNSGIRFGLRWWDESFNISNTAPTAPASGILWLAPIYFVNIPGYQAGNWVTVNPFNQDATIFQQIQPRWVSVEIQFIQDPAEIVWVDNINLTTRCTPPPANSTPGWVPRPGTTFGIRNPYAGYTPARYAKGQLHCHYYNDTPLMGGRGSWSPSQLMLAYGALGYDFVCVTEHYHCTTAPLTPWPLYIRYCEEVTKDAKHVLALGINSSGCGGASSGMGGNEYRYLPWDAFAPWNGLCEVEQYDCSSVEKKVHKIHDWGGMAIAAHPSFKNDKIYQVDNTVTENETIQAHPDAISVYTAAVHNFATSKWDSLLFKGLTVPTTGGTMLLFGATEDDFTPIAAYQGMGRTWALAELDSNNVTQDNVMRALKLGRFWSYWSWVPYVGTGPTLRLTTSTNADGKPVITVTSSAPLDDFVFVRSKPHIGVSRISKGSGTSAEYVCDGDEIYVRVEAFKRNLLNIYSQPIGLPWNWSSGSQIQSASARLTDAPADIVYTCAQPEELPDKMPPLGYIGRAYFASTSSGTYPADATLTMSYEGQDVTPYGASNLAIYRWDVTSSAWVKLTGTIDIGNALITAPLTQAGLYAISAEIIGDATAPTVTIHTPTDGATLTGPDVVGVQAYDNVGVSRVSFYLNDEEIGVDSTGYDGYTCGFDFGRKSAGAYTLKVVAEDVSGNTGQAQETINISSSGVTPTVTITSPSNNATLENMATVTGTCGDDTLVAGVFVAIDGLPVGEADVTDGNWTYNLDTSTLANGPHQLLAKILDGDLNTSEVSINVIISGPTLANVSAAKMLEDGQRARLSGRVVTLGNPGYENAFYIEEQNRFSGVRVEGGLIPVEGDMVSVSGLMSTVAGERAMVGADVLAISSSNPLPAPLGLVNTLLGGGPSLFAPGVTDGHGVQNLGLLVRIWGKITQKGPDYLYINDGSNLKDGTLTGLEENVGVRVICDQSGYNSGELIAVTGVSSSFTTDAGSIARQVITRRGTDINRIGG